MKVASVQVAVVFGDAGANACALADRLAQLRGQGIELAVFPECYLTGYCVESKESAAKIAIPRDHGALAEVARASRETGVAVCVGFAESSGDELFNTAALFVHDEPPRYYRKTHLPELGYDNFATPGSELEVFDTGLGKIGVLICFDQRFPEPARVLALQGAELILLPTNWPDGAQVSADHMSICRAAENRVWLVTCDRVGEENGFRFIGSSKIVSPAGKVLAAAGADEIVLTADIDLAEARQKRTVTIPGKYETDAFKPRRPDLYRNLLD